MRRNPSVFIIQAAKTGVLIFIYGILSITGAGLCAINHEPLLFGSAAPLFLSGIVLVWMSVRIWQLRNSSRVEQKDGNINTALTNTNVVKVSHLISQLRPLRTAATVIFSIGIIILVISCVFRSTDSIIGLSLAIVIQFGALGVIAMMTNFWLEIYANELERHRS